MPFDPNQFIEDSPLDGVIVAAKTVESKEGVPGLWVQVDTDNGVIPWQQYLSTLKSQAQFEKTMNDLGVSTEALRGNQAIQGKTFWDDPGVFLINKPCSVTPEIDTYNGTESWRSKWLNPRRKEASATAKQKAASLFRGRTSVADATFAPEPALVDVDVPF